MMLNYFMRDKTSQETDQCMVVHLFFTEKSAHTFSCGKYENAHRKGDIYTFAHKNS